MRYEQSSFDLRSTEVQLSQMATHRLGLELMYHGKNFAGGVPSRPYRKPADVGPGLVSSKRTVHGPDDDFVHGVQANESGGYVIPDLASFNFRPVSLPQPIDPSGSSSVRHTQIQVALMRREAARTDSVQSRRADTRLLLVLRPFTAGVMRVPACFLHSVIRESMPLYNTRYHFGFCRCAGRYAAVITI